MGKGTIPAYQAGLAGDTIHKTFGQVIMFLTLTGADAASSTDISQLATRSLRKGVNPGRRRGYPTPSG